MVSTLNLTGFGHENRIPPDSVVSTRTIDIKWIDLETRRYFHSITVMKTCPVRLWLLTRLSCARNLITERNRTTPHLSDGTLGDLQCFLCSASSAAPTVLGSTSSFQPFPLFYLALILLWCKQLSSGYNVTGLLYEPKGLTRPATVEIVYAILYSPRFRYYKRSYSFIPQSRFPIHSAESTGGHMLNFTDKKSESQHWAIYTKWNQHRCYPISISVPWRRLRLKFVYNEIILLILLYWKASLIRDITSEVKVRLPLTLSTRFHHGILYRNLWIENRGKNECHTAALRRYSSDDSRFWPVASFKDPEKFQLMMNLTVNVMALLN